MQRKDYSFFGSLFVESLVCCVQPFTPFLFPHCIIKRIQGTLCRSPVSLIYSLLVLFALLVTGSSSGAFRFRSYMRRLRDQSSKNRKSAENKAFFNAFVTAKKSGALEVTVNGKRYRRANKCSGTWRPV